MFRFNYIFFIAFLAVCTAFSYVWEIPITPIMIQAIAIKIVFHHLLSFYHFEVPYYISYTQSLKPLCTIKAIIHNNKPTPTNVILTKDPTI